VLRDEMPPQMSEPVVLISHPILAPIVPAMKASGFRIAIAWELSDDERAEVRAIVHAGEFVLAPEFLASLPKLGLIAAMTAGYDGVDVPWCRARGIEVTNAAGVNADDVADHAMGLVLAGWRGILAGDRIVREGRWRHEDRMARQPQLTGRRLGILGMGHIGQAVAVRAEAFKLQVSWWGPNPKPVTWPRADSVLALARGCDILMVAVRGGAATRGLVTAEVIDAVGPAGMIVNVARGSVIDEDALIAALKAGRLGRAALDVFAEEPTPADRWADVPGTVLTPHRAGGTTEGIPLMLGQAIDNVRRFLAGEPVVTPAPG